MKKQKVCPGMTVKSSSTGNRAKNILLIFLKEGMQRLFLMTQIFPQAIQFRQCG